MPEQPVWDNFFLRPEFQRFLEEQRGLAEMQTAPLPTFWHNDLLGQVAGLRASEADAQQQAYSDALVIEGMQVRGVTLERMPSLQMCRGCQQNPWPNRLTLYAARRTNVFPATVPLCLGCLLNQEVLADFGLEHLELGETLLSRRATLALEMQQLTDALSPPARGAFRLIETWQRMVAGMKNEARWLRRCAPFWFVLLVSVAIVGQSQLITNLEGSVPFFLAWLCAVISACLTFLACWPLAERLAGNKPWRRGGRREQN